MRKVIISACLMTLMFVSCKDEKSSETPAEAPKSLTFDVIVDLVIPQDEELILYYKDGNNEWFVEDKAVWNVVKGKAESQSITFSIPQGSLPNDVRLDIGRNDYKGLKSLELKKITFSYNDKKFEIAEDQIQTFFRPNQYIGYDPATKLYSFKKDEKGGYDPFFETKAEVYPQIAKIATN